MPFVDVVPFAALPFSIELLEPDVEEWTPEENPDDPLAVLDEVDAPPE